MDMQTHAADEDLPCTVIIFFDFGVNIAQLVFSFEHGHIDRHTNTQIDRLADATEIGVSTPGYRPTLPILRRP